MDGSVGIFHKVRKKDGNCKLLAELELHDVGVNM